MAGPEQEHLVEVPLVARSSSARSSSRGIRGTALRPPLTARLVADDDATLGEQVLDVTKAEVEAEIQPDGVGDHLGREAMAPVERHAVSAAGPATAYLSLT